MWIIKHGTVTEDTWQRPTTPVPDQPLPDGDWIVPLDYWCEHSECLAARNGKVAVCLNGNDKLEDLPASLESFELMALEFPKFTDGRSYSHARLLRERHGYRGELRAVGEVLRDRFLSTPGRQGRRRCVAGVNRLQCEISKRRGRRTAHLQTQAQTASLGLNISL